MSFTDWTLAAGIEAELIRFEASTGTSVEAARRPLTDEEVAAGTRFGDIDAVVTANTVEGTPVVDLLYAAAFAAVLTELFGTPEGAGEDTAEVVAAITALYWILADRTPTYREAVRRAEPEVARLITASHSAGAMTVIDEARRQGVDTTGWGIPPAPRVVGALAADVVGHPLNRVVERVLRELQAPHRAVAGRIGRAELQAFLTQTSRAGTIDILHQANQAALALGRIDMVASVPTAPSLIIASEILDTNTCQPCKNADGRRYRALDEAAADYPAGYARCLGKSRCRGVLVFLWDVT